MLNLFRTDIRLYALDPDTGRPMTSQKLTDELTRVFGDLQKHIGPNGLPISGVAEPVTQQQTAVTGQLTTSEVVLIAIAAVVIFGGEWSISPSNLQRSSRCSS